MSDLDKISARVEADRSELASSLDALTETVAPQKLASDFAAKANDVGGALAQHAWGSLRAQPAGGLLVGIGLAMLAAGSQRAPAKTPQRNPSMVDPEDAMEGFDARVAEADAAMSAQMSGGMVRAPEASKLRAAVNAGLDQLPPQSRKRVRDAREAVIAAQEKVERKARKAARQTESFVHEQPLTVGAIALGFGVLAGTLLPSTRREDALLGARRDALMDDARTALEEEMEKAKGKAETAIKRGIAS